MSINLYVCPGCAHEWSATGRVMEVDQCQQCACVNVLPSAEIEEAEEDAAVIFGVPSDFHDEVGKDSETSE